ncbi:MAG TPA: YciI-like protein [Candidatus Acidoferrum sp.]|jgi:hypothetical protein|nr:YciI-like protein [Candidatus Acidoferrum sp.]
MAYYALFYEVIDDYVKRRGEFREPHLRVAGESLQRGELVLGGALAEPVDRALLVFQAAEKSSVEDFARKDPYVLNGLVKKWEVRPWNVVVGNKEPTSSVPAPTGTILRQWTARATQEQWPGYRAYFSIKVLPELRKVDGFLGARLCVRHAGDVVEILVETSWRSLDSIRAFAGPDVEASVVSEEAIAMLTEFDGHARHYETVISD